MKKKWRREMAVILSAALVFGNLWPGGISARAAAPGRFIEEFKELPEDTLFQIVPFGTKKKDLDLPNYINARLAEEEGEENEDGGNNNGGDNTLVSSQMAATGSEAVELDKADKMDGAAKADGTPDVPAFPSDLPCSTGSGNVDSVGTDSDSATSVGTGSGNMASGSSIGSGDKPGSWRKVKVRWVLNENFSEQETYDGDVPGIYVFEAELASDRYGLSGAELPAIEVEVLEEEDEGKVNGSEATPSELSEKLPEELPDEILITDWTYLDDGNLSGDGSLTLHGANPDYSFDEVVSLLPGRIQAVAEEDGSPKTLPLTWDSPDYREARAKQEGQAKPEGQAEPEEGVEPEEWAAGSYLFRWELPEGYTLSEDAKEPELLVTLDTGELSLEQQARLMEEQMAMQPFFRSGLSRTGRANQAGSFRFTVGSEGVLRELQEKVADGATWADGAVSYAESSYVLNGDIWLTEDWTPVGTEDSPFTGTFDGDGHVIYGMVIDAPDLKDSGLFGYVKGGTVEQLGLKDVDIRAGENAGAVAGTVYQGTVSRCYSTGNVEAAGVYPKAGGIVGCASEKSSVSDCYSLADVEGCYAGGIAGEVRNSAVGTCYSTGQITAVSYLQSGELSRGKAGGLAGSFHIDENRSAALADSVALNPSIEGDSGCDGKRGTAFAGAMGNWNFDLRGIYGFTKMQVMGITVSGEADDNLNGADFWYDAADGTFSTPWETIFRDSDAWGFGDGKLPALKDVAGQDGEIPEWMVKETAADLYIENAGELARFRDRVNGTAGAPENFKGRTVRLTADIDLDELDSDEDWVPIGTSLNGINCRFSGTFDGGGHVIRGVTLRSDVTYAGLFGEVAGGRIRNLGLKDVDIDVTGTYAGAAAGYLQDGEIVNCYSTGIVTNDEGNAGGIAGICKGESSKIENCYSTAAVRGRNAGGIAGGESETKGMIENCYFAGNAVIGKYTAGGIRGDSYVDSHIRNCAALNAAVAAGFPTRRIAADDEDNSAAGSSTVLKNNYAFSGMKVNGALVAADDAKLGGDKAHGANLSYDKTTGKFSVPWETIFGERGVKAWDIGDGKLPTLKDVAGQDGEIPAWLLGETAADLYIGSARQLAEFRDRVNGADGQTAEDFKGKTVRLTADINLDELDGDGDWVPIGAENNQSGGKFFSGTFDGDGHVISGLTVRGDTKFAGLFGKVAGGRIRNLGLKDVVIDCGAEHAGAVAGLLQGGEITNCYSTGIVRTTEDSAGYAGGIAAQMLIEWPAFGSPSPTEPKIENCYSTAAVEGKCAGGITGMGTKTIKNCYFAGNAVTGTELAGGIAGDFPPLMGAGVNHCAALNVGVDGGKEGSASRIIGGNNGDKADNYAFSGMKVNGKIISEDHDKAGKDKVYGANLSYDRNVGEFDVPWVNIFDEDGWKAWDIAPYKLPTLKGIGGQDGEIPLWLSDETAADLYIGSTGELAAFRDKVNAGDLFTSKTVRLTADIELDSSVDWVPIGTLKDGNLYPFCGVFDGGGHVIRGLTLRSGGENGESVGLFGNLYDGEIRNLGVTDVDIDCKTPYAGAVAGILIGGKISSCYSTGLIRTESAGTGSAGYAGGIAGVMDEDTYLTPESIIENCYSTASVTGPNAGGVTGGNITGKGTVKNCYFAGNAVSGTGAGAAGGIWGGVMNHDSCSVINCAALNITVDEASGSHARIIKDSAAGGGKMENNYAFSGMKLNGSVVPENDAGAGADRIHGANLSYDRTTGQFDVPWETIFGAGGVNAWDIEDGKLPTLKGIAGQDGEIPLWLSEENAADLYIGSETDLIRFRDRVNGTGASDMESFEGKTVRLTADITLGGGADWTPIGEGAVNMFSGTFDGGGHVIRGLKINDENKDYLGLFGQIYGGTVRNLGLEEVRINGRAFIGGIAGYLGKGSSVLNCYSMGSVRGDESVGGLVGAAFGKLRNEDDRQKIVIRNCWYAGDAKARDSTAGGIAGGFLYGCEMEHCYSIGKAAAKAAGGGLIGCVSDSSSIDEFTGAVRYNAALMRTVDGPDDVGRIYGTLLVSSAGSGWKENYAWSGMTVGGTAVQGDDGIGKHGKDGTPGEIVLNSELFPASDWILQEGYYPRLRQFAGGTPIPLDVWLGGQSDGAFAMTMTPGAYRFPDAEAGYGAQESAVFTVKNTGREKIDSLTVELTGAAPAGNTGPYFILSGTETLADIAAGDTAVFSVTPADGLAAGSYRITVLVTGDYALKAETKVEFTVKAGPVRSKGDRGSASVRPPAYAYLNGEVPSSVGDGVWEKQPGGIWKFHKNKSTAAGSLSAGGPAKDAGGGYAAHEWLYIDGFWYLFDTDGRMIADWACVNGAWYYLSTAEYAAKVNAGTAGLKEGAMVTGWFFDPVFRQWFWLDERGVMAVGWVEIDGKRYYFNPESDGTKGALKEQKV